MWEITTAIAATPRRPMSASSLGALGAVVEAAGVAIS